MRNEGEWVLASWERAGFPVSIRMATAFWEHGSVPGYDHRVTVGIELRDPNASGQPGPEEWDDLEAAELDVCKSLEAGNESLCVLVITGNGLRDIMFYVRDPEEAKVRVNRLVDVVNTHKLQVAIEPESNWRIYRFFSDKLKPNDKKPN